MKDFFISYNKADKAWAEWAAWVLEEAGYSVIVQAWDIRPGGNFVLEMHKAAAETQKTVAVLSENYLLAAFTGSEWAAAFLRDPKGEERQLIPIRVGKCEPKGLLAGIVYVDLVGLSEDDARVSLLGGFSERGKPASPPHFPGAVPNAVAPEPERVAPVNKGYPGAAGTTSSTVPRRLSTEPEGIVDVDSERLASPTHRWGFVQKLNALPPQQFNMLIFALNPPAGMIPSMPAPQGDRTTALVSWAEGTGGCGLIAICKLLHSILNPR